MKIANNLTRRERVLVLGALPLIALFGVYRFGWLPLVDLRAQARNEIAGYRTLVAAAQDRGDAPPVQASVIAPGDPLANRVTRSAEAAGVLVRRLEPDGDRVRISLDDATFDTVILWIAAMEADEGIALVAAEIDRRTAPGTVSARLTVETAR